ncbi:BLUF domain-containing protein [Dyadobacter sp. CY323]|uniref:BLUF domain-containing protein n=1 Tax=Dyadobacter sp. CY323 TaxID=2907302 RepID=UPI001F25CA05|nr:BLUF domain-containing protein [Dyadobacter sp. CY323]
MDYCLVYISSSNELSADQLRELSTKSQEKNRLLGITGALLYCNGSIIQVLEGEEEKVNILYNVIAKDRRHNQVTKLYGGQIKERSFSDWLMGYRTLTQSEMSALEEEIPFIRNPYSKSESKTVVMSLVQTFYKNNHRN